MVPLTESEDVEGLLLREDMEEPLVGLEEVLLKDEELRGGEGRGDGGRACD